MLKNTLSNRYRPALVPSQSHMPPLSSKVLGQNGPICMSSGRYFNTSFAHWASSPFSSVQSTISGCLAKAFKLNKFISTCDALATCAEYGASVVVVSLPQADNNNGALSATNAILPALANMFLPERVKGIFLEFNK